MSTTTSPRDTEELAQFRERWKEEIRERTHPISQGFVSVGTAQVGGPSTSQQIAVKSSRLLKSALELYTKAVFEEQSGNHPEATRLYRYAFRSDPNVDKAYRREELLHQRQQGLSVPAVASLSLDLKTVQADRGLYESHSLASVVQAWPLNIPFVPENETSGVPLSKLPDELIVSILLAFAVNMDASTIERFAMACRRTRLLCLDTGLWRRMVELIMVPSQLSDPKLSLEALAHRYKFDYRRMYIEHPHLRFDGVYISICHYTRNGLGENPWVTMSHLITYRRFLRFLPNGKVLSYRANEDQEVGDVIHSLQPGLQRKDLCIGDWQLSGTTILVTDLMDIVPQRHAMSEKYNFQMILGLKSRPGLGRWNKIDILHYDSINLETGDVSALLLRNERPYWFSKVKSYRL